MPRTRDLSRASLLRKAIDVAKRVEGAASRKDLRKPVQLVGYGFLVRNRRIAVAIARLGKKSAYESQILLRTMLEIWINYAWIRLRNKHSRALRFLRFWPIERLRLLEKTATIFSPSDYDKRKAALEAERRNVRHLFRFRDTNGKMRWARSWASVSSVEVRLREVLQEEAQGQSEPDPFIYGTYIKFSSVTHGSPCSLNDVLNNTRGCLAPTAQPEPDPEVHYRGAFYLLARTIEAFAEDAGLQQECADDIRKVTAPLREMAEKGKQ